MSEPITVRALLEEPGRSTADALADSLDLNHLTHAATSGVRGLTTEAHRAVESRVAALIDGFLGMDLLDLAAAGWSRHAALTAAARRTRDAPGSEEVVAMATHRITSTHHPTVDLCVDGVSIGTVEVELVVRFDIEGLIAVVREGRLVAARAGACTATGTLTVERVVLAERRARLDLPATVRLRSGLALLPAPDHH